MAESRAWDLHFQLKISVQENIKFNSHNSRFSKTDPLKTARAHFGQMTVYIFIYIPSIAKVGPRCPKWGRFGKTPVM